ASYAATWIARRTDAPSSPGCRAAPCRLAARGTGRAGHARAPSWPYGRQSTRTAVSRVLLGVFWIGGGLKTVLVGPGIEVGNGIHDAATELAKARATADHTLLFQRTWRQAKVGGRLFVREVALRLDSSKLDRKSVV